jgi:oligosaccharide repeat unit polymerase
MYVKSVGISLEDISSLSRKRGNGLNIADGADLTKFGIFSLLSITELPLILLIFMTAAFGKSQGGKLVYFGLSLPLLCFAIFWPFVNSVRTDIMFVMISLFLAYYMSKGRLPVGFLIVGGAGVFVMFAAMTFLRQAGQSGFSGGTLSVLDTGVQALAGSFNLGGFVAVAHAIAAVPTKVEFQDGQTFLSLYWMVIPRMLWPEKPVSLGFLWLDAFNVDYSMRLGGGAATGLVGEGYLNFGSIGAVLVMPCYAIIVAAFYHFAFVRRRPTVLNCAFYVVFMPEVTYSMYGYYFTQAFLDAIKIVPMFALMALLLISRRGVAEGMGDKRDEARGSLFSGEAPTSGCRESGETPGEDRRGELGWNSRSPRSKPIAARWLRSAPRTGGVGNQLGGSLLSCDVG